MFQLDALIFLGVNLKYIKYSVQYYYYTPISTVNCNNSLKRKTFATLSH